MALDGSDTRTAMAERKQPLVRWLRLLQLLSMGAVFASGYAYAKFVTRFQPRQRAGISEQAVANPLVQLRAVIPAEAPQNIFTVGAHSRILLNQESVTDPAPLSNAAPHATFTSALAEVDDKTAIIASDELPQLAAAEVGLSPNPTLETNVDSMSPLDGAIGTYGSSAAPPGCYSAASQPRETASPEVEAANTSVAALAAKIQQAKKDEKPELSAALKLQLGELFKLRHAAQAKEIEEMSKELEQAKTLHAKRNENQEEIIERRFRQLIYELDDLDWERGLKSPVAQPHYGAAAPVPLVPFRSWAP